MKKLLFVISCLLVGIGAVLLFSEKTVAAVEEEIAADKIYVFVQRGCPHCISAEKYLKEKHADLDMELRDISERKNYNLFLACGAKFKLNKYSMGTPLFCMGENYVLGWGEEGPGEFEEALEKFLPKE